MMYVHIRYYAQKNPNDASLEGFDTWSIFIA